MDPLGGDGSGDGDVERRGAGHGRGRGSWLPLTPTSQEIQMLRRPHHGDPGAQTAAPCSAESRNAEQSKPDKSHDDIIKNSTLSVHAAEFIPKSYPTEQVLQQQSQHHSHPPQRHHQQQVRPSHKHSVQNRFQMARENPNHVQAMPTQYYGHNYDAPQHRHYQAGKHNRQFENFSHQQHADQRISTQDYGYFEGGAGDYKDRHQQESSGDEENCMLDIPSTTQQLMNVVHSLILNPGRFTSIVPPLINNLRPYLGFPSQFREIVGIIIQQSINEGNFRYSGARLCTTLNIAMSSTEQASLREILYALCKEETENQATAWQQRNEHTEEQQIRCHGLILFLAELVTQMEDTCAFGLGELLIQLITVILKKPALHSVKHICQVLKLAGSTLEKDKRGNRKEMENMMRALTELVAEGRVDSHIGRMVHSVHELRNKNWGQGTSTIEPPMTETPELSEPLESLDEPVQYGPDGQVLSAEETQFLEDVAATSIEGNVLEDHGYGGGDKWMSDDEDEEEYDAAYEEFLKNVPPRIGNKTHK